MSHHRLPESGSLDLQEFACAAYGELRRIAGSYFKHERPDHTLQPTALVHEVYVRLALNGPECYDSRAHFFGTAARAMRQVLVESARNRATVKRGRHWQKVPLDGLEVGSPDVPDYLAIDCALTRLAEADPALARIAELRVFSGLSTEETAEVLDIGASTARARWAVARAWLGRELRNDKDSLRP